MATGDKIRYFRELRGLNKKELGIKLGYSPSTATVRISQYEYNQKKPKLETLLKIADILCVDISSLDDTDLTSAKQIMQTLFEFENKYSIKVEKQVDNYSISFENLKEFDLELQGYMDTWLTHQKRLHLNLENREDYNLWRNKFPLDIKEAEELIDIKLSKKYAALIKLLQKENFSIATLSDFATLIWCLSKNLTGIKIYQNKLTSAFGILSFDDAELLLLNDEISTESTKFLLSVDYLNSLNIKIEKRKHTFEEKTYTDFYIYEAPFWTIITSVNDILNSDDNKETRYNDFLKMFNVPIIDYRR